MKRKWGLGCWSVGGNVWSLYSAGQIVSEIVRLSDGFRTFFRGKLVREKPYTNIGNARLAAERALRKETA